MHLYVQYLLGEILTRRWHSRSSVKKTVELDATAGHPEPELRSVDDVFRVT